MRSPMGDGYQTFSVGWIWKFQRAQDDQSPPVSPRAAHLYGVNQPQEDEFNADYHQQRSSPGERSADSEHSSSKREDPVSGKDCRDEVVRPSAESCTCM